VKIPSLSPTLDLLIPLSAGAKKPNGIFEDLSPNTDDEVTESKSKSGEGSKIAIKSKQVILTTSDIGDELASTESLVLEFEINHFQHVSVKEISSINASKREISAKEIPVITKIDSSPRGLIQMQGPHDMRASQRNILTAQEKYSSAPIDDANSLPSESEFQIGTPKKFLEFGKNDLVPYSTASIAIKIPDSDLGYRAAIIHSLASDDDPFRESDSFNKKGTLEISELDIGSNAHQKAASLNMFSDEDLREVEDFGNKTITHKQNPKFVEQTRDETPLAALGESVSKAESPFGGDFGSENQIRKEGTSSKPGEDTPNKSQTKQTPISNRKSPMHVPKMQNEDRALLWAKKKLEGSDKKKIIFKKRNSTSRPADQKSISPEKRGPSGQGHSIRSPKPIGRFTIYRQKMPNVIPPDQSPPPINEIYEKLEKDDYNQSPIFKAKKRPPS
jgi:hypothetical protein